MHEGLKKETGKSVSPKIIFFTLLLCYFFSIMQSKKISPTKTPIEHTRSSLFINMWPKTITLTSMTRNKGKIYFEAHGNLENLLGNLNAFTNNKRHCLISSTFEKQKTLLWRGVDVTQ